MRQNYRKYCCKMPSFHERLQRGLQRIKRSKLPATRFWMGILIFFAGFMHYSLRCNITVSLTQMIYTPKHRSCLPFDFIDDVYMNSNLTKFHWNKADECTIVGAYFIGFFFTAFFVSPFLRVFGAYNSIFYSSIFSVIFNTLTPVFINRVGWFSFAMLRFVIGLCGGLWIPAVHVLITNWAPVEEKNIFLTAFLCGGEIGTFLTWTIVASLTEFVEWKMGFYVISLIGCVFCGAFALFASDSPASHFMITNEELSYIEMSQQKQMSADNESTLTALQILQSKSFLAVSALHFASFFGAHVILLYLPEFLDKSYNYRISQVGPRAGLPALFRCGSLVLFYFLGRVFSKRIKVGDTLKKKITVVFTHFFPAAWCLLIIHNRCNFFLIVVLLLLSQVFNAIGVLGQMQNSQDILPMHVGKLYGMLSALGHISGFFVVLANGIFVTHWFNVMAAYFIFELTGFIYIIGGAIFICFGCAQLQVFKRYTPAPTPTASVSHNLPAVQPQPSIISAPVIN